MPELPEVENVRRGLAAALEGDAKLVAFRASRFKLRKPVPLRALKLASGARFARVTRWGKYLFFETESGRLLNHLGMTGSWSVLDNSIDQYVFSKHDHLALEFSNGKLLVYNDPRRFGWVEWLPGAETGWMPGEGLGVDPTVENVTADWLRQKLRGRKTPIKSALMNQDILSGLGNIYVSEILFRSGLRPSRRADRFSIADCEAILRHTHQVLEEAIDAGGSTISDYRKADGGSGGFQDKHQVYGRAGKPCVICTTQVKVSVIAGRSTFWCPRCQKA